MKILITGSEGFVGSHLQDFLSKKLRKAGLDFDITPYDLVLGDDIRDRFKLDKLFESENFDFVISLAARAGVRRGEDFPEEYFTTNVLGLKNLVELSEKYHVKKFIHFSSSSVFGSQEDFQRTREDDPKNPVSNYGITKLWGEKIIKESGLNYTIIRPFTIIGKSGRKEMVIYKWINQIKAGQKVSFYGDGSSYRGYTNIEDILEGVYLCMKETAAARQVFNMGGHQRLTLDDLWQIFLTFFPNAEREELPMPVVDQMFSWADTTKAEQFIGWKPKKDVVKVVAEIIESEI